MGKSKTEDRQHAQDFFVNNNLTLKEVAALVSVTQQQVGKWAKEENWQLQRTAKQTTAAKIIAGWYAQLQRLNEEIEKQGGIPTTAQADSMSKIADNIQKLSKKQNLSMYHSVLTEFTHYYMNTDAEAAKSFSPLMLDFLKQKAAQLSKEK